MRFSVLVALLWCSLAWSKMPSNPLTDPDFMKLPDGSSLSDISVSGAKLFLAKGTGSAWGTAEQTNYQNLRAATERDADHPVQWTLMNLDNHQVLARSYNASRRKFGASCAKVFTAGTLLTKQNGTLSKSQKQIMADMIVVSSNDAWMNLQGQIGDGNQNLGRQRTHEFTTWLGYLNTRGFQGTWNGVHGNELNAAELAEYLYDTYHARYPGAEINWKLMHAGRTGSSRGKKYIPNTVFVGGKTGTYAGGTVDPDTGKDKNPDGSPYTVSVNNHILVFSKNGRQYALTILANTGRDEDAALIAGGIYREIN